MKKPYYHLKKNIDISHLPEIKGYDFEEKFDFDNLIKSYSTTGLQASELGKAIEITKVMIREKTPIFLSMTSNIVSSGLREIIKYLVKNNKISVLVTSAGAVEEDILKAIKPFRLGDFHVQGEQLLESGIGRIGNIFTTNEHYTYLELYVQEVFDKIYKEQKEKGTIFGPSMVIEELGKFAEKHPQIDHESSILYWAYKNKIPVYCPAFTDGGLGDMMYFFKQKNPDFILDISSDTKKIVDYVINQEKTGAIILGSGVPKHFTLNSNIFKEGLDYAVHISTSQFFDGSDSGGNQEEAISWAKIKTNALRVKVYSEASLVFPLLVAATFAKK